MVKERETLQLRLQAPFPRSFCQLRLLLVTMVPGQVPQLPLQAQLGWLRSKGVRDLPTQTLPSHQSKLLVPKTYLITPAMWTLRLAWGTRVARTAGGGGRAEAQSWGTSRPLAFLLPWLLLGRLAGVEGGSSAAPGGSQGPLSGLSRAQQPGFTQNQPPVSRELLLPRVEALALSPAGHATGWGWP